MVEASCLQEVERTWFQEGWKKVKVVVVWKCRRSFVVLCYGD